jgi:hypothetical protein
MLAGCGTFGATAESLLPAVGPLGARIDIHPLEASGSLAPASCELLAVQDSALVLSCGTRLSLVPYGRIRRAAVQQLGKEYAFEGGAPAAATRERLRTVSRFPQGLRDEWLASLLSAAGQPSLDVLPD